MQHREQHKQKNIRINIKNIKEISPISKPARILMIILCLSEKVSRGALMILMENTNPIIKVVIKIIVVMNPKTV